MEDAVNRIRIAYATLVLRDCACCHRCENCTHGLDLITTELVRTDRTFREFVAWRQSKGCKVPAFGPPVEASAGRLSPSTSWWDTRSTTGEDRAQILSADPGLRRGVAISPNDIDNSSGSQLPGETRVVGDAFDCGAER